MTCLQKLKRWVEKIVDYKFKSADIAFHPVDVTIEERKHRDITYNTKIQSLLSVSGEIKGISSGTGEKNILVMDDIPETSILTTILFKDINKITGRDIYKDYTVHYAFGPNAAAKSINTINNNKIDVALLDITLGEMVSLPDGSKIEIDGVDIALYILDKYPTAKVLFLSAHSLNMKNPLMKYYYNKFINNTNLNIEDFYVNKACKDKIDTIMKVIYNNGDK